MNPSNVSFYQAFFGGALTFYGIAIAVIVAAIQIVQANLSFKIKWSALVGKVNLIMLISSVAVNFALIGAAVAAGSYNHDIFTNDLHSSELFQNILYFWIILASTLIVVVVAIICLRDILKSLLPANLIERVLPFSSTEAEITDYILYRYATEPHKPYVIDLVRYGAEVEDNQDKKINIIDVEEAKIILDRVLEGDPEAS